MLRPQTSFLLMLVIIVSGCHWPDRWAKRRDRASMQYALRSNQMLDRQTVQSTPLPEPPIQLASANGATQNVETVTLSEQIPPPTGLRMPESNFAGTADRELSLHEAIQTSLNQSRIARVADGGEITTSGTTFYDVEASEARLQAALAAFDTQFESQFYSNQFNNPPNAFFGPGLTEPLKRDEGALTASLAKPLRNGGTVSAAYNPSPGYLFLPGSTTSGFNPTYASHCFAVPERRSTWRRSKSHGSR